MLPITLMLVQMTGAIPLSLHWHFHLASYDNPFIDDLYSGPARRSAAGKYPGYRP